VDALPLVSVIVPNYNYGRVLGLCLRAVQAQSYPAVELVLVDDGSTDDSVAVAGSLGVPVVRTGTNQGVSAARNLGARVARGEILFFLDSDIALEPGAVAAAVEILRADPGIGAVCGNFEPVPLVRDSLVKEYRNLFRHHYFRAAEGPITGFLPTAMIAMRREVWDQVGPFSTHLHQSEGAEVGERLTARYTVLLTSAVRGCHDDDQNLRVALRKVFVRTKVQVPFFLQRRYAAGVVSSPESGASLAAVLTLLGVAVPFLAGWPSAVLPVLLAGAYLSIDRRLYRQVFAARGAGFGLFFVAVHYLVNLTIAVAAGIGIAQWLVSGSFRRLYDRAPA
jgi:glycosyltransferase involved in cell wall biosynthesis